MKATVIVPTTGDRGPLLSYSVGSILAQTVRELEVFIIGDGVEEVTRGAAKALERQDPRVRFMDFSKGARRGEIHRHEVLQKEAGGEIVCYLCDRDLMLPDHVEVMLGLLTEADFAHTLCVGIRPDGSAKLWEPVLDLTNDAHRADVLRGGVGIPLSFGGHTLAAYRRLPLGWRTTPTGQYTDQYMWHQMLVQPGWRFASGRRPTVLYFRRGEHPGMSSAERLEELQRHHGKVTDPAEREAFRREVERQLTRYLERHEGNSRARPDRWTIREIWQAARRRIPGPVRHWIRRLQGKAMR